MCQIRLDLSLSHSPINFGVLYYNHDSIIVPHFPLISLCLEYHPNPATKPKELKRKKHRWGFIFFHWYIYNPIF